jgi:hypothetical protein
VILTLMSAAELSDRDLLDATVQAAADERRTAAGLVALLAELDSRKLYLAEGFSSLFTYCTQVLHLSESAAYSRITVARAVRRFPILLSRLVDGDLTLTTISLLAAHLTDENHEPLMDATRHASRRDVERLIAGLHAQPDIPASVRRMAAPDPPASLTPVPRLLTTPTVVEASMETPSPQPLPPATPRHAAIAPVALDRYFLRVTISGETQAKLDRARDLLRHTVPNGDIAVVLDRALTVLIEQLERRKAARVSRSRPTPARAIRSRGRHIPASVRRDVWARDEGRCAFIGPHGRCLETGFLEYHHVVPFAKGGASDAANLELRCRAHNMYEAAREFGEDAAK